VIALSPAALVGLIIAGYIFYLAPFYSFWNEFVSAAAPSAWRNVIIFQVAMILVIRWVADSRFKNPLISTIMHPVGFSFLLLDVLYAGARRIVSPGIDWKDRLYGKESGVE